MLVFPLAVGRFVARRFGVPWSLWAYGALTFVASQVVHLPLNWATGLLGKPPRGLGLMPLPLLALVAGLSAGLCEELTRYVALCCAPVRRQARSWLARCSAVWRRAWRDRSDTPRRAGGPDLRRNARRPRRAEHACEAAARKARHGSSCRRCLLEHRLVHAGAG